MNSMDKHYKQLTPEPIDIINAWGLDFNEGNILKYLARYKYKGAAKADLCKLVYYATILRDTYETK